MVIWVLRNLWIRPTGNCAETRHSKISLRKLDATVFLGSLHAHLKTSARRARLRSLLRGRCLAAFAALATFAALARPD